MSVKAFLLYMSDWNTSEINQHGEQQYRTLPCTPGRPSTEGEKTVSEKYSDSECIKLPYLISGESTSVVISSAKYFLVHLIALRMIVRKVLLSRTATNTVKVFLIDFTDKESTCKDNKQSMTVIKGAKYFPVHLTALVLTVRKRCQ